MTAQLLLWNILSSYQHTVTRPHILLIVADDLGWNDVGWNNPDIKTPNLDVLAHEGVIMNASYVGHVCSPSRGALMTGFYPHRLGMQHGALKRDRPYGLPIRFRLLPEKLKQLGYSTHIIGKWHLGFCKWSYTPTYRGFDTFYGFYNGAENYVTHRIGQGSEEGYDYRFNTKVYRPRKKKYSTTDFSLRAVDLITYYNNSHPLFIYLPYQAVHLPLQVPKKFERMYSHIRNKERRLFSGMVSAMDDGIGKVMAALMKKDMLQNTLIVFLSDNGAAPYSGGSNWPLRGGKASLWEGGTRVPTFVWGQMLKKTGYVNNQMIHAVDWFPTLIAAAGGKTDKKMDGINQWDMVRRGTPTKRKQFVYSINEINGRAAIRVGKYKLISGSPGFYNKWYLPRIKSGRPHKYYWMKARRNKNRTNARRFLNQTMLFNIEKDPTERRNIAKKRPELVLKLQYKLQKYKAKLVPALNPPKSKQANPSNFGGVWSPGWC